MLFAATPHERPDDPRKGTLTSDARSGVRLREPQRRQLGVPTDLDSLLPPDEPVRAIWALAERLDLSRLYALIRSRGGNAGAPAVDPRILFAIWVLGTSEGEGSARALERNCKHDLRYLWLCGGVRVHYRLLSDFRRANGKLFLDLVVEVLAPLLKEGLADLSRVAQDGMRVRASAGADSFRREETLQALRDQVRVHVETALREASDSTVSAVQRAARLRGARDRQERIERAIAELREVAATKQRNNSDSPPRVSTTDPQARVMKMPDGGFRPAYNVQFATTTDKARVVVGVAVTNRGSDANETTPMLARIEESTGVRPAQMLADGGFAQHTAIEAAAAQGTKVYAPVQAARGDKRDPHERREGDSEAVAAWRARMATPEAKAIYKQRCATAETVNADTRCRRGLGQVHLRGLSGALTCASLSALTYNVLRVLALAC